MTPGERAAARLLERRDEIARAGTEALYAEKPWLLAKYGERGRQKCLQDMRYNVEHLAPAVELDAPAMFEAYARWVDDVLRARNVPTGELVRALELMERAAAEGMDDAERGVLARCVAAGVSALGPEAR
ncbi:MAG TPA: hypothetical protein VF746_10040 [Longimicrobium sp.]